MIVVNTNEPIDAALRRLQKELNRENLIETLQKRRRIRKKQQETAMTNKLISKMSRRRRQQKRRMANKGRSRRG